MDQKKKQNVVINAFISMQTNPIDFMRNTTFKRSELGLDARVANHWAEKGLFNRQYEIGNWLIFDLPEAFWVKIVMKMREFNVSLEVIKKIKESFFEKRYPLYPIENKNYLVEKIKDSELINKKAIEKLTDDEIWQLISKIELNHFELMIQSIILERTPYFIIIDNLGNSLLSCKGNLHLESNIDYQNDIEKLTKKSHIRFSMNEILGDLVKSLGEFKCSQKIPILSKNEAIIIGFLRQGDIQKIEIKFSKDSKPEIIEITSTNIFNEKARLSDLIISRGYQSIQIKTQQGQIVHCENKIKYKLDTEQIG